MLKKSGKYAVLIFLLSAVLGVGISHASDYLTRVRSYGGKIDPILGGTNLIYDIYFDKEGNIYLPDYYHHKVLQFDREGELVMEFGEFGVAPGKLNRPQRIAVDSKGNIFVLDYHDLSLTSGPRARKENYYRVSKFDHLGNFQWTVGGYGKAPGKFYGLPSDLETDKEGNLYVLDRYNYRVQKFDPLGNFVLAFGSYGKGEGEFDNPAMLAFDQEGNLFVLDSDNHRVQKFNRQGKFLLSFGKEGYNPGEFTYPRYLYIDKNNLVSVVTDFSFYTSSQRRHIRCLIEKYDSQGHYRDRIYALERFYDDDTSYSLTLLNLDSYDRIFVFHSRDRTVDEYQIRFALVNLRSMRKHYYLEVRKPVEESSYRYDYPTSFSENFQNYSGINPRQTINLSYYPDDRTTLNLSNTLSLIQRSRAKNTGTDTSSTTLEGDETTLTSDSSLNLYYLFDKTKNKNITYTLGHSSRANRYEWDGTAREEYNSDSFYLYTNLNVDITEFSDFEIGYNKNAYHSDTDTALNDYLYRSGSFNDYYYLKYHADF